MKRILLLAFLGTFAAPGFSQSIDTANVPIWIEMMQDPNANFFETQKAFEIYWEGRERNPGDGYKVFRRWENHKKRFANLNGELPSPNFVINEFDPWRVSYNQNQNGPESENGTWIEIGPIAKPNNGTGQPNGNGRLNTICFHPTMANTMWVGAPAGGLWKTTDGGSNWTSNTDEMATLGVSSMLVDPTDTSTMYLGSGDRDANDAPGLGVYKSTNSGVSWTQSNSGMGNKTVGAMVMHPSNSSYILAATSGGIYRTQNAGTSWSLQSNTINFKDIKFKPGSSNIVYATEASGYGGFYKSTDGGASWTEITSGLPSNAQRYVIGVSADDPNVVYVLCSISSIYGGLFKSTDSGATFSTQSTAPNILDYSENGSGSSGQGWYDLAIEVDPNDADVVFVGGVNIWKSTNSGVAWDCAAHWVGSSTAASVHADQHWFAFSPVNGNIYACNDGGIYYSANGGTTWPELSSGLGIGQLYKLGVSQQTHELVINGYQDNGTALWDNTIFRTERGGDGMECLIDYSDDNYMYASVYYGNIARSTNNGYSFGSFAAQNTNGITESGAWVTPYILDKDDPNIMFIGYKNVWRTIGAKSANVNFEAISNNLAGSNSSNMRQLRQSKVDGNRLFSIRGDNKFFRSDNALGSNPSWSDLTSSLPYSGTLRDVETSPTNNNILWISLNNQIWKSTNGGSSWTNITSNLPNLNYNTIMADPLSNGGLYVGSVAGIYYIDNSLSSWITFDDDFPSNVSVEELEIYHPQGDWEGSRIRAATYGRGLWESDLYDPGTLDPMCFIDLSLDSTDICGSDTITMYNNTAYGVTTSKWIISPSDGVSYVNGTDSTSMNPQITLANAGNYDVKLVVTNTNGADSLTITNAIVVSEGLTFPWFDDFEDNILCSAGGCQTSCSVNHWRNISNNNGDDIDWRPDNEGTPWSATNYNGANTGPSVDYTVGDSSGIYLYISSYPPYTTCYNKIALLESPCLSLVGVTSPEFKFAYHMFGNGGSFGDLDVDVYSNGTWTNILTESGGNLGDQWNLDSVSLSSYLGESIKLRFAGHSGSGWQADIAIDGIELTGGPEADFIASDTLPCLGETIIFTDSSSQNPTNWAWTITPNTVTFMGGTNANSQHPLIRFDAAGSYQIVLSASNQYDSDFAVKSNYINVIVPPVTLISNASNGKFCQENPIQLSVAESYPNYAFYENTSTLLQSGTSSSYSVSSWAANNQYQAIVTDSAGCKGSSSVLLALAHPSPVANLSASDVDLSSCEGDTITFTSTTSGLSSYDFQLNGTSQQAGASNEWISSTLSSGDEVWAIVTDTNGCEGNTDTLLLVVNPLPFTPNIIALLDSLECSLIANQYNWTLDDSLFNATDQRVEKLGDGAYRLRIYEGGCWSLWSDPFIITGIEGLNGMSLKLYPSPATDVIYLEFLNGVASNEANVRIIDMGGRTIVNQMVGNPLRVGRVEIPTHNLAAGVYSIVLNMNGENYAMPFVKESK
jgi:PKD repeat protein/photosystem II stability/assembly factor-like uncharacterized protein